MFTALILLSLATLATAQRVRVCGPSSEVNTEARIAIDANFNNNRVHVEPLSDASIDVHWHVVTKGDALEEGHIPEDQIAGQIDALNEAYSSTGLSFELVNTTYVNNPNWFANASDYPDGFEAQSEMKQALRQGDAATLNLYSVGFEQGTAANGLLGYARFPWGLNETEFAPIDDGVVFLYSTVPGGSFEPFNLGGTLQHEVGHWVGLYHVFNEGTLRNTCNGSSDQVDDTPVQRTATSGCPAKKDTCPQQEGADAVHNYMDYSDDSCYDNFTVGQIDRLTDMMATYRGVQF